MVPMEGVLGNLALEISFGDFLWSLVIIFFMIVFFVILFQVLIDLFRSHDIGGWAKAGWVLFIIILPFLGLLVYLIVRGKGMAERARKDQVEAQQAFDDYVRTTASSGDSTAQIANAKKLLDEGTITQEEFERLKAKALG
jgi:Short C-terminal domain/Phospholipase_D-nuclease N-terminal